MLSKGKGTKGMNRYFFKRKKMKKHSASSAQKYVIYSGKVTIFTCKSNKNEEKRLCTGLVRNQEVVTLVHFSMVSPSMHVPFNTVILLSVIHPTEIIRDLGLP